MGRYTGCGGVSSEFNWHAADHDSDAGQRWGLEGASQNNEPSLRALKSPSKSVLIYSVHVPVHNHITVKITFETSFQQKEQQQLYS